MEKNNFLFKNIKEYNKYLLILLAVLFISITGLTSYAVFTTEVESSNTIQLQVAPYNPDDYIWDFVYTGNYQEWYVPKSGYYEVELWGGSTYQDGRAQGGYTKGTIYMKQDDIYYLYVGDRGTAGCNPVVNCTTPAFNGGGLGPYFTNPPPPFRYISGGGATDIRLIKHTGSDGWSGDASLRSRIMVAGGAGASSIHGGGNGGGLVGETGIAATYNGSVAGLGGNQMAGGTQSFNFSYNGVFGRGGDGLITTPTTGSCNAGLAGGGGYFGGAGGKGGDPMCQTGSPNDSGGGGGSSYISGYAGVNSVQQTGGTASQPLISNNTIHYSNKFFVATQMQIGINTGAGKAKITYLGKSIPAKTNTKLNNIQFIKICTSDKASGGTGKAWNELQAIKDGINVAKGKTVTYTGTLSTNATGNNSQFLVDGNISNDNYIGITTTGLQCATVDLGAIYDLDEIAFWGYWADGRTYLNNILSVGLTNQSGTTNLATILHDLPAGYTETSQGRRYTAWD